MYQLWLHYIQTVPTTAGAGIVIVTVIIRLINPVDHLYVGLVQKHRIFYMFLIIYRNCPNCQGDIDRLIGWWIIRPWVSGLNRVSWSDYGVSRLSLPAKPIETGLQLNSENRHQ